MVSQETLQGANRYWSINLTSLTIQFAGASTDISQDSGKRRCFSDYLERFTEPALRRQVHVVPGIQSDGAGKLARGRSSTPAFSYRVVESPLPPYFSQVGIDPYPPGTYRQVMLLLTGYLTGKAPMTALSNGQAFVFFKYFWAPFP